MTKNHSDCQEYQGEIIITPLGTVDEIALRVAAATIQAVYSFAAEVAPSLPFPEFTQIPLRNQYHAGHLLCFLQGLKGQEKRIGITSRDIALPFLTYVFGETQVGGRAAVISTFRLKSDASGFLTRKSVLYDRLAKIAVHETGHLMGLEHCRAGDCIMGFSMGLEHLDALPLSFCRCCAQHRNMI